jgi:hypothetical protein
MSAEAIPARTVSFHLPEDLATLAENLADARFRLLRTQREATKRAGRTWDGGRVRRSASGVVADALAAQRDVMQSELAEIEAELARVKP